MSSSQGGYLNNPRPGTSLSGTHPCPCPEQRSSPGRVLTGPPISAFKKLAQVPEHCHWTGLCLALSKEGQRPGRYFACVAHVSRLAQSTTAMIHLDVFHSSWADFKNGGLELCRVGIFGKMPRDVQQSGFRGCWQPGQVHLPNRGVDYFQEI